MIKQVWQHLIEFINISGQKILLAQQNQELQNELERLERNRRRVGRPRNVGRPRGSTKIN